MKQDIAEFKLWEPEGRRVPRYVVALVPGSQSDGRGMVDDPVWQAFATEHGVGLVGCYFRDAEPSGIEKYADAKDSGWALIDFLTKTYGFCPLILVWGFSAGGQFAYEFAVQFSDLCRAFVVNKGGVYYTALAPEATRTIPGLWILGDKDAPWRKMIIRGIYLLNRQAGAVEWQLMVEATYHEVGESVKLGQEFFAGVLKE